MKGSVFASVHKKEKEEQENRSESPRRDLRREEGGWGERDTVRPTLIYIHFPLYSWTDVLLMIIKNAFYFFTFNRLDFDLHNLTFSYDLNVNEIVK